MAAKGFVMHQDKRLKTPTPQHVDAFHGRKQSNYNFLIYFFFIYDKIRVPLLDTGSYDPFGRTL